MQSNNKKVDSFLSEATIWKDELLLLRNIALDCELTEELKWGVPCYTSQNNNIVLIHTFKEYCAILFIKGVLLRDSHEILIQQTKNVQAGRQIRFKNIQEIKDKTSIIKDYIVEAIEIDKAGTEIVYKKQDDNTIPEEFKKKLKSVKGLKTAFEKLTPGRQRGYLLYFSAPKQSKTREARIEKHIERILDGKGLNDLED